MIIENPGGSRRSAAGVGAVADQPSGSIEGLEGGGGGRESRPGRAFEGVVGENSESGEASGGAIARVAGAGAGG